MNSISILQKLVALQNSSREYFPDGIFPSYRYHPILPYSRPDDNVYFTSFILIILKKVLSELSDEELKIALQLILKGEDGIKHYKNRFGDVTYNFYRPDGYFPNGKLLSKFKKFQPTDDLDDTSIAYRAMDHSAKEAKEVKNIILSRVNGQRNQWIKRAPTNYRKYEAYSTWIGTDSLYIDFDICVLANYLCFNAQYDLGIAHEDIETIRLIEKSILTGEYLTKNWGLSAWYPSQEVIFYQLSELFKLNYYSFSTAALSKLVKDISNALARQLSSTNTNYNLLHLASNLLGIKEVNKQSFILEEEKTGTSKFTYGVIPLLHPFNGMFFQKLSSSKIFQLHYKCESQELVIRLWLMIVERRPMKKPL